METTPAPGEPAEGTGDDAPVDDEHPAEKYDGPKTPSQEREAGGGQDRED